MPSLHRSRWLPCAVLCGRPCWLSHVFLCCRPRPALAATLMCCTSGAGSSGLQLDSSRLRWLSCAGGRVEFGLLTPPAFLLPTVYSPQAMIAEVQRWPGAESLGDAKVRPAAGGSRVEPGSVPDSSCHGSMPCCTSFLSCPQECLDFASAAWCRLFCRLHGGELLLEALLLHSEALEQGQRQAEPAALAALQALHSLVRCVARLLHHLSVGHETAFSCHPSCILCSLSCTIVLPWIREAATPPLLLLHCAVARWAWSPAWACPSSSRQCAWH